MNELEFKGLAKSDPEIKRLAVELSDLLERIIARYVDLVLDHRERENADPVVYFIQAENGGPIKIGVAKDPAKRLTELQATSPYTLLILGTVGGGFRREKELHAQFADWRLHGEWFSDDCEDLRALIADCEAVA